MTCQDVADWFSAIGTVGTLIVAIWKLTSGAKKDRDDRRRHQAQQLTAWVDETNGLQIVSNRSGMPVYDAVLTFTINVSDGRQAPTGEEYYQHAFHTLPPGDWQLPCPKGWHGMGAYPGVELAFRDAGGQHWLRTSRGELKELDESPINYYGIGYPYGSNRLTAQNVYSSSVPRLFGRIVVEGVGDV